MAKTAGKTEQQVRLWMLEPAFCQIVQDGVGALAVSVLARYISGGEGSKDKAMVALALMKILKPSKVGRPPNGPHRNGVDEDDEDGSDLREFSSEQIKRLRGRSSS